MVTAMRSGMLNRVRARVRDRLGLTLGSPDLAHALKNEMLAKVNYFGEESQQQYAHLQRSITDQYGLLNNRVNGLEARLDSTSTQAAEELRTTNKRLLQLLDRGSVPVGLEMVNERIIEVPFVFNALADLPLPSQILDVGGEESTVGLSLASLGHSVDLVEPGGFPVAHPNLTVHEGPVEEVAGLTPPRRRRSAVGNRTHRGRFLRHRGKS